MSVVKINAITVPGDSGDELAHRFASRSGAVDQQDGFEGFELLRPTDGRTTWLVITRWRDDEAFLAWTRSPDFARAHQHPGGTGESASAASRAPVGVGSELWSFSPAG
jgi:heme-degrading monooxygenase HmoA